MQAVRSSPSARRSWLTHTLLLCSALACCSSTVPAESEPATAPAGARSAGGEGAAVASPASAPRAGCRVRQAQRTFVGFAEHQSLDDFEATALEAERVLHMLKAELCRPHAASSSDPKLRAAIGAGLLEITAVRFTRADLSAATAELREPEPATQARWLLQCARTDTGWQIVSTQP